MRVCVVLQVTRNFCACKESWTYRGVPKSWCDRANSTNTLFCEVASPAACPSCKGITGQCVFSCSGGGGKRRGAAHANGQVAERSRKLPPAWSALHKQYCCYGQCIY